MIRNTPPPLPPQVEWGPPVVSGASRFLPSLTPRVDWLPRIHSDALQVLEEGGVVCDNQEVRRLFENTGLAAFDELTGRLHLTPLLVEQALVTAPKKDRYWVPENSFGIGGLAPFVFDDDSRDLVQPTYEHVRRICQVAQQADAVGFVCQTVAVPDPAMEVNCLDVMVEHCDKPIYVQALTEAGLARVHQVHQKRGRLTVACGILTSPLRVNDRMVRAFLACVRKDLPTYVVTMPIAALSAPYSLSGLLTLTHAEALFGITLAQLARPGAMVLHGGLPSVARLEDDYSIDLGPRRHTLANVLLARVAGDLGLPAIQSGCGTNAEEPGPEAEMDAMYGYALARQYGFHQLRHAFGMLRGLLSFSIAKLERHLEICQTTTAAQAPEVPVEAYDPEGAEVIIRNIGAGTFMNDDHTLKHVGRSFAA